MEPIVSPKYQSGALFPSLNWIARDTKTSLSSHWFDPLIIIVYVCPQIFCHLKPPWWVCGSSVLPVFFVPGMTQLDRSPTFLTSDGFIRSKEIIEPKWLIYEVIGHFVLMFWWYHQNIRILAGDRSNVDPLIICVCLCKKLESSIRTFQKCTVLRVIFKTA